MKLALEKATGHHPAYSQIAIKNRSLTYVLCLAFTISCHFSKPYNYRLFPQDFQSIQREYENYYHLAGCQPGETIASIGAGNGLKEIQISYFVEDITWYLQEIDSARLYDFYDVLAHHENIAGTPSATFNLVVGTEKSTSLPKATFDRILMINVFHEIEARKDIMMDVHKLLKENSVMVIMERMGKNPGEIHGDCKYPRLIEADFLAEMEGYGYRLSHKQLGEEMSNLMFYVFEN